MFYTNVRYPFRIIFTFNSQTVYVYMYIFTVPSVFLTPHSSISPKLLDRDAGTT